MLPPPLSPVPLVLPPPAREPWAPCLSSAQESSAGGKAPEPPAPEPEPPARSGGLLDQAATGVEALCSSCEGNARLGGEVMGRTCRNGLHALEHAISSLRKISLCLRKWEWESESECGGKW